MNLFLLLYRYKPAEHIIDVTKYAIIIIFYCGSGWRSAMAWVMSQLLGLKNCKSYDGSFLEWNKLHPNSNNHQVDHGLPINMPLIEKVVVEETKLN